MFEGTIAVFQLMALSLAFMLPVALMVVVVNFLVTATYRLFGFAPKR